MGLNYRLGVLTMLLLASVVSRADWETNSFRFESVSARFGNGANKSASSFNQVDACADANLPWHWDLLGPFRIQPRLEFSAGWLTGQHLSSFVGSAGVGLLLSHHNWPLNAEAGILPTYISRSEFGFLNLGTEFQFTSHLGVSWDFATHFRLGYRIQHMSNGGLSPNNPGLNMNIFSLSYLF
jgi:hypothetical protein